MRVSGTDEIYKTCKNIQISKQHKARELDMVTLRNHALRSYMK